MNKLAAEINLATGSVLWVSGVARTELFLRIPWKNLEKYRIASKIVATLKGDQIISFKSSPYGK